MQSLTRKNVIKYALLPGFRQRFRDVFATGFQYIPYFMALVYGAVRLLPANHPYLISSNMGRFGIRHVLAEAANNITFNRRNIDQIMLFFAILFGLVLIAMQIGLLGMAVFLQPALAAMPTSFPGFFSTTASGNEEQDLAHIMLDMVFGVKGLFNSCVSINTACTDISGNSIEQSIGAPGTAWGYQSPTYPFPVHLGLHQLFRIYNTALTIVAVFISMYFIMTVILETAESGTPMGQRFNKVWAPVRFVMAFGLLFPLTLGYNSSQYIVLYAAKYGSGFATNGWNLFNDALNIAHGAQFENLLSDSNSSAANLVGRPNVPEVGTLLQFMFTAKVCQIAHARSAEKDQQKKPLQEVKMYLVGDPFQTNNNLEINTNISYTDLMNFAGGDNQVIIRFGIQDEAQYGHMLGYVFPTCGELTLKLSDPRAPGNAEKGIETMQAYYWYILNELWFTFMEGMIFDTKTGQYTTTPNYAANLTDKYTSFNQSPNKHAPDATQPETEWKQGLQDFYNTDLIEIMSGSPAPNQASTGIFGAFPFSGGAVEDMRKSGRWQDNGPLKDKGWAGAAIWYNRIAEMNGALVTAALNIPMPSRYPYVMEQVYAEKRQLEETVSFEERFNPQSIRGAPTEGLEDKEKQIARALWYAFKFFQDGGHVATTHTAATGNAVVDIINALFGTDGIYSMRRNPDTHPLAQLAGVGRSLIEASLRNLTYAAVGGTSGALLSQIEKFTGAAAKTFSGFLISIAMIGLTAGFVLFYIVPFLPFIYFFFAVSGWVKGIFEAMVGAPLWALAHLRIDGNGLPGQAAVSGYFLIFEVFLRPILIVFGLLASISIFSALVSVLNQTFDLVVSNVSGFDASAEFANIGPSSKVQEWRSAIDEFFFTIIYVIIVYLMGMASFKLVDLIPNNILRWMGQSVATFGDQSEDSGQALVGTATVGSQQTLSSVGGGLKKLFG